MSDLGKARTRWAAVGAAVAITLGAVGLGGLNIASADVSEGDRPVFISMTPCRLLDTRPGAANVGPKSSPLGPGEIYTVAARGDNGECVGASSIPTDALSLSLNVTAVGATSPTFLTFWGDGANPGTSNLNPRPGAAPTPNSVNTPLSDTGTFNIYNDAGNVGAIVDVNGYYVGHDHDDRYARKTTELYLAHTAFESRSVSTGVDRTVGSRFPGIRCALAPVPLTDRLTLVDVTVTVQTEVSEFIRVEFVATPNRPAAGLTSDDITITGSVGFGSLETTGVDGELQTSTATMGDLVNDPSSYTYAVRVCPGVSELTVYGATVGVIES